MPDTVTRPSITEIRAQFPALASGFKFLENAGGSQVPQSVISAVTQYFTNKYVQTGATYPASVQATESLEQAREVARTLFNGESNGQVIFGGSSSALCRMLADAYAEVLQPGDEVIVAQVGHEANIGPWVRLERQGIKVRMWKVDAESQSCRLADLEALITDRSRVLALTHVSNLLGDVVDIKSLTDVAHHNGIRVVVDGVAFAPHRALDVQDWGCDWYVFSAYKVYGPHLGVLYGSPAAAQEITGPNHFFIPNGTPYKFELGCLSHELCAGLLGLGEYLAFLGGANQFDRSAVVAAFDHMAELERPLQERLLQYLAGKEGVKVVGSANNGPNKVPTISFIHNSVPAPEIVARVDQSGIGIRHGHMYAYRLAKALGIDVGTGVVRISLVHYNTLAEVEALIAVLDRIL